MPPNLFNFATRELSQDAVLCWLLDWARPELKSVNEPLHVLGERILSYFLAENTREALGAITSVDIQRQAGGFIDVLCLVNGTVAIVIEDKRYSKEHSNQLTRAVEYAINELNLSAQNVVPVYIQTGDQSDYGEVTAAGFRVVGRSDLLGILDDSAGQAAANVSDIVSDFRRHLRMVEDNVASFRHEPLASWTDAAWRGFYMALQQEFEDGNWDYVANPRGGFWGYWWHWQGNDECEQYLQLEQDILCFKIWVEDANRRRELRHFWHERIMECAAEHAIDVRRPGRFGSGSVMTVAVTSNYRVADATGLLDLAATVRVLKDAMAVLEKSRV